MKIFDLMLVQKIINLTSLVGWVAPGALPLGWTGVGSFLHWVPGGPSSIELWFSVRFYTLEGFLSDTQLNLSFIWLRQLTKLLRMTAAWVWSSSGADFA